MYVYAGGVYVCGLTDCAKSPEVAKSQSPLNPLSPLLNPEMNEIGWEAGLRVFERPAPTEQCLALRSISKG